MSRVCTVCGREVAEAAPCPYCPQLLVDHLPTSPRLAPKDPGPHANPSAAGEDLALDVCISYPDGGARVKHFFTGSAALLGTLLAWKRQGITDILLTWGVTRAEVRERVEELLREAGVQYRVPQRGADADRLRRLERENAALRERLAGRGQVIRSAEAPERTEFGCAGVFMGAVCGGACALVGGLIFWESMPDSLGKGMLLVYVAPLLGIACVVVGAFVGGVVFTRGSRDQAGHQHEYPTAPADQPRE